MDTVLVQERPLDLPAADLLAAPARAGAAAVPLVAGALSLAAAAIHFAFAPGHFNERTSHGAFFLAVAAAQAVWGAAVLARPQSTWLRRLGALNLVVIGTWIASRTVGIDGKEPVGYPDALATAFEAGIVVLSLLPVLGRTGRTGRGRPWAALAASALIAGSTVVALTPRFAETHDHGAGAHVAAGAGAAAVLSPCERAGVVTSGDPHSHHGPTPQQPLDQATRAQLAAQQEQARSAAAKYPTVADAERAGYRMSTPYIPCIGAHYTNIGLVARFDPSAPSELLYDGTQPASKLVGLSYLVWHPGGAPDGFAGPNDVWHQHNTNGGLCFNRQGVVIAGETSSQAECARLGGFKRELTDVWMLHDWVAPGWECTWGAFAAECPELGGHTGRSAWD